jgi:predicted amidohydrolase YtcJ
MGGIIDRNDSGEPTGILREHATELVERCIPEPSVEDCESATLAAGKIAIEAGLTSVHCIISSEREFRALLNLRAQGHLPLRFYVFIPPELLLALKQLGLRGGFGDEWVRLGGIKLYTDGSLGARTAALEKPYNDEPNNRGVTTYTQEELDRVVAECHRENLQVAIHAIGDRAIAMALESVRSATAAASVKDPRHRVEHASVLKPELITRFKELGLIASVQPHFVVSDFWIEQRLGRERSKYAYPFSSLLRAGVLTVAGSDCPIDPLSPLQGIEAAVSRPESDEAISAEDALTMYTKNAAYASFEEDTKGTIAPGKLADLVVLSEDPCLVRADAIKRIDVLMTIVGGRIVQSSLSHQN